VPININMQCVGLTRGQPGQASVETHLP